MVIRSIVVEIFESGPAVVCSLNNKWHHHVVLCFIPDFQTHWKFLDDIAGGFSSLRTRNARGTRRALFPHLQNDTGPAKSANMRAAEHRQLVHTVLPRPGDIYV